MHPKEFQKKIDDIGRGLNAENHRERKQALIALQAELASSGLQSAEKAALRQAIQLLFDRIRLTREEEQAAFERESAENQAFLKEKLLECIEFIESHLDDHELSWQKLLELQDAFRGRRLVPHEREHLYGGLQQLFQVVKKRREEAFTRQKEASAKSFASLDDEVDRLIDQAESIELDTLWRALLDLSDKVREAGLLSAHRKELMDRLQEGFVVAKIRKEQRQVEADRESAANASLIEGRLIEAAGQIENNPLFKENWQLLLDIQQMFRELTLDKDRRELLYGELQALFERVKSRQDQRQESFEAAADASVSHLRPMVDRAIELARTSREFKKTRHFLIKVQRDFKGRRMRSEEREKLYSRLQSAFDTLNRRINEHILERKEAREFRVDSQISDLQSRMEDLESLIAEDLEKISLLEARIEDTRLLNSTLPGDDQWLSQLQIMRAAVDKKAAELAALQEELRTYQDRKDWLDSIQ